MNITKNALASCLAITAGMLGLLGAPAAMAAEGSPTGAEVRLDTYFNLPPAAYSLVCGEGMLNCTTAGSIDLATTSEVTAKNAKPSRMTRGVGPVEFTQAEGSVSMRHECEGAKSPWMSLIEVTDASPGELEIVDLKPSPGSNELSVVLDHGGTSGDLFGLETVERVDGGCDSPNFEQTVQMGSWYAHFYYAHRDEQQATSNNLELTGLRYDAAEGVYARTYNRTVANQWVRGYTFKENTRIEVEPEWCAGDQNRIISAVANGESIGLGERFFQGQVVTAPPGSRIVLGDGSAIELAKGGKFTIDECDTNFTGVALKDSVKKFWTNVKKIAAGSEKKFEVQTERAVAGVRGTTFSVSYNENKELTKLVTEEGSVWFKSQNGAKKGRVVVDAGESATQKGKRKPVLKK